MLKVAEEVQVQLGVEQECVFFGFQEGVSEEVAEFVSMSLGRTMARIVSNRKIELKENITSVGFIY